MLPNPSLHSTCYSGLRPLPQAGELKRWTSGGKMVRLTLIAVLLALAGCVSMSATPESVTPKVSALLGSGSRMVWVPSRGEIADTAFMLRSGPSDLGMQLAGVLAQAKSTPVRVGISGPNSTLSKHVALEALGSIKESLPMLQLAFVGSASDGAAVKAAVEAKGGKYFYSPFD